MRLICYSTRPNSPKHFKNFTKETTDSFLNTKAFVLLLILLNISMFNLKNYLIKKDDYYFSSK